MSVLKVDIFNLVCVGYFPGWGYIRPRPSILAVLVYLFLGAVGLPVLARAGAADFLKPPGGTFGVLTWGLTCRAGLLRELRA